jgi:hypothetical protein
VIQQRGAKWRVTVKDDFERRIPPKKPKSEKAPSKPLIKAIIARIKKQKELHEALLSLWEDTGDQQSECMEELTVIVAQTLIDINEIKTALCERDRAEDLSTKTNGRWRHRIIEEEKRAEQLTKFSKVAHRELMAKYAVDRIAQKPARHHRNPYARCVRFLYDFFARQTPHPYKFRAAITGLFNLHPRTFCTGCSNFPKHRKPTSQRKIKYPYPTSRVRRGIDMCKLENIFECPKRYPSALK